MKKKEPVYLPHTFTTVKCRRDYGFIRDVETLYHCSKDGQCVYIRTFCSMHCGTETCIRCCDAVTTLLNEIERGVRQKPDLLDPEEAL